MELKTYLKNPCGLLSIPWWKHIRMEVPAHILIAHQRDFSPELAAGCRDQVYFRLSRTLHTIPDYKASGFLMESLSPECAPLIASIINASYEDIRVTENQIRTMEDSPAFCPALWILAREEQSGNAAGCAMGEFDPASGEMSIEWVQVLPHFRRRGVGRALVLELLRQAPIEAGFAPVSGRTDSSSNPESLYRSCGFEGSDYWHILWKEN